MATLGSALPQCLRVCSVPSQGFTKSGLGVGWGWSTQGTSLQGDKPATSGLNPTSKGSPGHRDAGWLVKLQLRVNGTW